MNDGQSEAPALFDPDIERAQNFATALWLEGPSAFWLHPEGPLAVTSPDEWRAKKAAEVLRKYHRRKSAAKHADGGRQILSADTR